MAGGKKKKAKSVETLTHGEAARRNIPTAEFHSVIADEDKAPIRVAYERRNRDLDPQLVWRGKDEQDAADLVVQAPPLYIQEKVHPKVLIDDLLLRTKERREEEAPTPPDLFADFNGLPDGAATTEFYRHDANWSNRMILGDSLQVMASLAEREGLRGKVQCIYIDPPYGIRFNSNFQWSTTSRDVKDGKAEHITREPEQVKAFSGHLARRHPFLPDLSARPADRGARSVSGERLGSSYRSATRTFTACGRCWMRCLERKTRFLKSHFVSQINFYNYWARGRNTCWGLKLHSVVRA